MSWLFSRALVAEYSEGNCSGGKPSVQLSVMPTQQQFWRNDKMMDCSIFSRFGLTYALLTESRGEELLTLFLEGFHVKRTQMQHQAKTTLDVIGEKCLELSETCGLELFSPKTSAKMRSSQLRTIFPELVTIPKEQRFQRETPVAILYGQDFGYLATPTTQGNQCCDSMMKHKGCRVYREVFSIVTSMNYEYLMRWPIGWTELNQLATDKTHTVQPKHSDN